MSTEPYGFEMTSTSSSTDPAQRSTLMDQFGREQAPTLMIIAQALLNDRVSARELVIQVFSKAIQKFERDHSPPDANRLFQQLINAGRSSGFQSIPGRDLPIPKSEAGVRIVRLLDKFDRMERVLCALHYGLSWSDSAISHLFNKSEKTISLQISVFERKFSNALSEFALKEAESHETAASIIQDRYSPPDWSLDELIQAAYKQAQNKTRESGISPVVRWVGFFVAALTIFLCAAIGIFIVTQLYGQIGKSVPVSTQNGTQTIQPTPARQSKPLTWLSDSDEIEAKLMESASLWNTIWADLQFLEYGPQGYIGAPRIYRYQLWVRQPDQGIQVFGLLSTNPSSSYFFTDSHAFYLNPMLKQAYHQKAVPSPMTLIQDVDLRSMIFPSTSPWVAGDGFFQVQDTVSFQSRDAIVVDWHNPYGQREARLWINSMTGVILRQQDYAGDDYELLTADRIVTSIAFDQSFPPASLAASVRMVGQSGSISRSENIQVIHPTPTAASTLEQRTTGPITPPSTSFSPAESQLVFQFSNNLETSNLQIDTSQVPIQLIADNYLLGSTTFGLPWMLRCDRSPDGYRLAFNTGSDGTSIPDDSLRWQDLREPDKVYQPAPDLQTESFVFSNDSRQIALFAEGATPELSGIYLVDLSTAEYQMILPMAHAESLVWSPDGEFLAMIAQIESGAELQAITVHVRSGQIAFEAPLRSEEGPIPADWPMANWGIPFPQKMGGVFECSIPDPG